MIFKMSGPWGDQGDDNKSNDPWGGKKGEQRPQGGDTDTDRIIRESKEQLRNLFGGGSNKGGAGRTPSRGSGIGLVVPILILALLFWLYQSFYQIEEGTRGLKMRFGKHVQTLDTGLNFAAWPIYKIETVDVDRVRGEKVGLSENNIGQDSGLMLTADENVVDIQFEVQWKITDPVEYQFNLVGQQETIIALAQSTMREVIAQLPLIPILNTERTNIAREVKEKLQASLDQYESGVFIQAVLLTEAVPPKITGSDGQPKDVAAAFRKVQDAEARRVGLQNEAKAQANRILGNANAEAAELLEGAEGYRAEAINIAEGDASRFSAVLEEYLKAPEVTRRRLYLETMEKVYGDTNKIMMDSSASDSVVPYLPLNELTPRNTTGANQ